MGEFDNLRPGDEALGDEVRATSAQGGRILRPDKSWHANIANYTLFQALMIGGRRVLAPPRGALHPVSGEAMPDQSYLRRLPGETSVDKRGRDTWKTRRDASAHDPVASRIIWVYVDTLFRQPIDRSAVAAELGQDILDDVDLQGTSAEDWLPWADAHGLSQGWMLGQVDKPQSADDWPSLAHQEAAGLRPYLQLWLPSRVWMLNLDAWRRVEVALIQEAEDRLRLWLPKTSIALNRKGERLGEPVMHGFDRAPLELFWANDPDPDDPTAPPGESAMAATSLIDLQILQHLSLLDDVQRKTGFPFIHVQRDQLGANGDPDGDQVAGPDLLFCVDAAVDWKSPPASCPQEVRAHIDWLEALAYKIGGVHRRSQDSVESSSGIALDWESAPIYATVQRWARRFRSWELRLWRLMARAMGKDAAAIARLDVIYPDDFSSRPVVQDLGQAQAIANIFGSYSDAPDWVKAGIDLKVRRALTRDLGHTPEWTKAIAAAAAELKPEPKKAVEPDADDEPTGDAGGPPTAAGVADPLEDADA